MSTQLLHGTVIVLAMTDNRIVIGADSFVESSGAWTDKNPCKIRQVGPYFAACYGLMGSTQVRFLDVVERAQIETKTWSEIVRGAAQPIAEEISAGLTIVAHANPTFYKAIVREGTPTTIVLFGFENGKPFVQQTTFSLVAGAALSEIHIEQKMMATGSQTRPQWAMWGVEVVVTQMQANPKLLFGDDDLPARIEKMIESECTRPLKNNETERWDRLPIDILSVTKDGAEWIKKKESCADIKPYPITLPK